MTSVAARAAAVHRLGQCALAAAGFALQHQSDRRAAQAPQPADDLAQRRIAQREAGQRVVLSWPVLCRLR